jgi:hypothetical protein
VPYLLCRCGQLRGMRSWMQPLYVSSNVAAPAFEKWGLASSQTALSPGLLACRCGFEEGSVNLLG